MAEPEFKRRFPRYEVTGLAGRLVVPIQIRVINISLGGMALETHNYLQFGRAYTLRLGQDERGLSLTGTVAWCALRHTVRNEQGEVLPVYRAGLKFEALSGDRSRELWELIRQHALVEMEDSVLGRFKVSLPGQTRMGSSYDFAVRKLSLTGLLIETDYEPDLDSRFDLQIQLGSRRWASRARVASIPQLGRRSEGLLTQIGLEFCDLEPDERSHLRSFIDLRLRDAPRN
jgi:c-di-GMP-binding flagellar brake protein YcgR